MVYQSIIYMHYRNSNWKKFYRTFQPYSIFLNLSHFWRLHPLDADRNARPVVGEDSNGKFRRESLP